MEQYYPQQMMHADAHDGGWGLLMMVFWFIVLAVGVVLVVRLLSTHNHGSSVDKADPVDIVKERYAKGEITKDEFETLKKDLK
jgi:putative membrane protein